MKTYRVWRQEVVMYHNEVEAKNKTEAYEKALDLDVDAWLMGECDRYDSWKDSYVRKDLTEIVQLSKGEWEK